MSSLAVETSTVIGNALTYETVNSATVEDEQTVYTFGPSQSGILESVFLFCDFAGGAPGGDVFQLILRDQAGNLLAIVPTPVMPGNDTALNLYLTWMRYGNDSGQGTPLTTPEAGVDPAFGFFTGPLPSIVLGPNSLVNLQPIRGLNAGNTSAAFQIVAPVLSIDDGAGTTAGSSGLQGVPLLTATATG